MGVLICRELNLDDVVEALSEMRLHSLSVSGLRENFQELVIGEEEETREGASLGGQVVLQALLNLIEGPVVALEST